MLIEMPIDNTDTERLIRDMVMGKKSYLFCRDLDACRRAAMMYSLFGWRKRSIPTHSEWLYPLTFDAGNGLKEA